MEEKTRRCKYCGSEIKIKIGLHNWRSLFRKPTFEDYITLFIILMIILSAYAYKSDIQTIKKYYENENYCYNKLSDINNTINLDSLISIFSLSLNKFNNS